MKDDIQQKQQLIDCFHSDFSPIVELVKRIGVANAEAVFDIFGGSKPHLPTSSAFWSRMEREIRHEEIRAQAGKVTVRQLGREYGLSLKQVYCILKKNYPNRTTISVPIEKITP